MLVERLVGVGQRVVDLSGDVDEYSEMDEPCDEFWDTSDVELAARFVTDGVDEHTASTFSTSPPTHERTPPRPVRAAEGATAGGVSVVDRTARTPNHHQSAPVRRSACRRVLSSPKIALNRRTLYRESQKIPIPHPRLATPIMGLALSRLREPHCHTCRQNNHGNDL